MTEQHLLLKPMKFGNRLRKYSLITHHLNVLDKQGNIKDTILKVQMANLDNLLKELGDGIWKTGTMAQHKKEAKEEARKQMEEKNRKDIEDYLPILCNQCLVMACTVFDGFLVDSSFNAGGDCSLALDSADKPHISYNDYTNGNLKYAKGE